MSYSRRDTGDASLVIPLGAIAVSKTSIHAVLIILGRWSRASTRINLKIVHTCSAISLLALHALPPFARVALPGSLGMNGDRRWPHGVWVFGVVFGGAIFRCDFGDRAHITGAPCIGATSLQG